MQNILLFHLGEILSNIPELDLVSTFLVLQKIFHSHDDKLLSLLASDNMLIKKLKTITKEFNLVGETKEIIFYSLRAVGNKLNFKFIELTTHRELINLDPEHISFILKKECFSRGFDTQEMGIVLNQIGKIINNRVYIVLQREKLFVSIESKPEIIGGYIVGYDGLYKNMSYKHKMLKLQRSITQIYVENYRSIQ